MTDKVSSTALYKHARRGWLWGGVEQFAEQGMAMLVSLVLARLLEPSAFGLIASVAIFITIAQQVIDGGIGQRVVQKIDLRDEDYSTLFWCNGLISFGCAGLLVLCSGLISRFYENPQLRLIVVAMAGIILVMSAGRVHYTLLTRELRFRAISIIRISSVLAGCVAGLILAFSGFGVWALLGQQAVMAGVRVGILWVLVPWKPTVKPSLAAVKDLYGYGLPVLLSQVVRSFAEQFINVLIAKRISVTALGFFDRGRFIPQKLGYSLSMVFGRSNFPVLSKLQQDETAFCETYLLFLRILSAVYFMLLTGLAVCARDLIQVLLGDKWLPSVWFLQANCAAFLVQGLFMVNAELLRSKGRTGLFFRCNMMGAGLQIAGVVAGIPWGARGMVIGDILARILACLPVMLAVRSVSLVTIGKQLRALLCPLAGAIGVGVALVAVQLSGLPLWPRFILSGFVGLGILFLYWKIIGYQKKCIKNSGSGECASEF